MLPSSWLTVLVLPQFGHVAPFVDRLRDAAVFFFIVRLSDWGAMVAANFG
ncbi:MAG TPA: hypothetical protein VLA24_09435 [Pseudomonadales bacterium]|nr:hypothetical protein [Pseudomonadales bacterium]